MRFLLVEDNPDTTARVAARLAFGGHGVDRAATLAEAEDHLAAADYDLILLDIRLRDGNGRDFLAAHRRAGRDTPVIVTMARAGAADRVAMLDAGADDCLTGPFDFGELEARVRAVLRRRNGRVATLQTFADLAFDPQAASVTVAGETRDSRNRELRLFEVVLAGPERIYSKGQLCDRLFSAAEAVTDNAIEVYVGRLRRKLDGSRARIETIRGMGYRLTAL